MRVMGQTVRFDSTTQFDDFPTMGTSSVVPGQMVQVSGFTNPDGTIRATLIERHMPDWTPSTTVELKGTIGAMNGSTLAIGDLTVDATGVTMPTGTGVGSFVKVEGKLAAFNSTTLKATSVSARRNGIEIDEKDGDRIEVEGYVRNLNGNRFMVGDTLVNAGTLSLAGIANGVKVEVKGTFLNGILIAREIEIEDGAAVPPPTTVPAAPVASAVGGVNQVTVSWNGVSGATSYNIYWSTTAGVTPATGTRITGVTSPYVHTGRTAGTTYYYVVTAVNSAGESAPSAQVSATPTSTPAVPAAPLGVSAVGGANQVTISWAAVAGATSYTIYWSTATGVTPATGTPIANATSPYVQTGLTAGTTYYYVVTAVNATGESAPSAQVSATTAPSAPLPPTAPTGVTATAVSPTQVNVAWSAVTGAVSYNIYWSTTAGVTPATGTLIANATSPYSHTGRTASTTYYYVVTAVNAAGESVPSAQASATTSATPLPPAAPTGVTAVGGTNQVTVSWATVTGATYNIYWSTTTGVTPATGTLIASVTSPFVHMGLTPSTTYYYVVTATVGSLTSAPSAQVSATTSAAPLVCGTCHAIPPATGQHAFHVTTLGYSCAICHGTGYSSTTVNTTLHLNGVVNVVSTIGFNPTTSTCATPGCHGSRAW
ncbi:fibronectin type III domain-containing protein [Geobacter luticola]|uniref:Fibronectin type III domain-containing protein n=2 Tax=Geomobilimonas luticola TaxID=1114878 RepID=A0ABS5SCQ9_9BACT|nr:fibronectin type III domain-containing protein [Geomobilimonas luticola]